MTEQWQELKETITEMRDNDGTGTQQEVCKFLANLMDVLEKQISNSEKPNKWIPVSERLPELNKPLLVTAYHRVCYAHMISESGNYGYPVFRLHGLKDSDRGWVQETISHEPYSMGRIDAWMYIDMPQPYKVEPQEISDRNLKMWEEIYAEEKQRESEEQA